MSSCHIRVRALANGKRSYDVRFRLGGRAFAVQHAGAFRILKEARTRRDLVAGELAAGRDPRVLIAGLGRTPITPPTVRALSAAWIASRLDLKPKTRDTYSGRLERVNERFGEMQPSEISVADIGSWIAELAAEMSPGSVGLYAQTLRQLLDFAQLAENPARSSLVKLPRKPRTRVRPPSSKQLLTLLSHIGPRWRLPIITLEQTGMRVSEGLGLTWGDVDVADSRFLLSETKTSRPRWVQVPRWLMDIVADTCPLEDRTAPRLLFPGIERTALSNSMRNACKLAGIPSFSAHDLRHRRLSLWHGQGVPAAELAARAGHSRPSMTLDVYSHTMSPDEAPQMMLAELLTITGER